MERKNVSGLLVTNPDRKLLGILTRRDILFRPREAKVRECMTPAERLITAPPDITLEEAKQLFMKHKIEKLPLVDGEGRLKGLITSADIVKKLMYPNATRDSRGRLMVAAAVGVREDAVDRAEALLAAGADALVIDVAHGHTEMVIQNPAENQAILRRRRRRGGWKRRNTRGCEGPGLSGRHSGEGRRRPRLRLHNTHSRGRRRSTADGDNGLRGGR
jgi:CBS-domain-containing membrane protein